MQEFQTHVLYGFLVGVLVAMANTNVSEVNALVRATYQAGDSQRMEVDPAFQNSGLADKDVNIRYRIQQ